ncbi:MAG TPA: porphobilinogen synthase [Gemmatimonadaceae bacterium]|nr:porphobilinogen synthase [Gemmatimonadaceae bacterium]
MFDDTLITQDRQAASARPRRLRTSAPLRDMLAESRLTARQLVHPMFVREGSGIDKPIGSMPGHAQRSVDRIAPDVDDALALGIPALLLFGIPEHKDETGSGAWDAAGPVPRAIAAIKRQHAGAIVIADVCMCEYTSHGHCGVLDHERGTVANDETLPLLARAAVAYADAGADVVAPSAMMDGQVAAIRRALDDAGHRDVAILSYAVKYASAFYGPFREAAESAPAFGDRRSYQMDPPNVREALREAALDVAQGADMLMVKPAGPYLDIIRAVRERFELPLAAYQVSGEYAMLKAAVERGWLDERRAALEALTGIRRAGADIIITYYAKEAARWLREG